MNNRPGTPDPDLLLRTLAEFRYELRRFLLLIDYCIIYAVVNRTATTLEAATFVTQNKDKSSLFGLVPNVTITANTQTHG